MGTHHLIDADGRRYGIMTLANIYQYKGFLFEFHTLLGPVKLKKNWDSAAAMGRKFWKAYSEWDKLTAEEKRETQIYG